MSYANAWLKWFDVIEGGAAPLTDRMIALSELEGKHSVLDIGTGLGEPALSAATRLDNAGHVLAVDRDPNMIALARERAKERGVSNIEYRVHGILKESPRKRAANTRAQTPALLKGLIFTEAGTAMTPTATKKGSRLYRYYTSMDLIRSRATGEATGPQRLPAGMVEDAVIGEVRRMVCAPEIAAHMIGALSREGSPASEAEVAA